MAQSYLHFCPVARSLEKIGDKWALLIIRDLLHGPQRFTDLLHYLNNITPKWLTRRLRDLEAAGIVARDKQSGRREVWYQLTAAGRELGPVIEALMDWGFRWAMRPPQPGEVVHPDQMMRGLTYALNKKGRRLPCDTRWAVRFPSATYLLCYDEGRWFSRRQDDTAVGAAVTVTTTLENWATIFSSPRSERSRLARSLRIEGDREEIDVFKNIFGIRQ
ncbi:winged helix-turn-helix transcriptional regulator [Desulfatitalea alkaliphila]|uniref:Helix-turn-helix transcriptional regulator n=1 Tax=Desulfatitalea alkaliphila TaxID=2929485 RepID=A0AA41R713_9BACT|nr:helix-turn-helix domain-containing protein [Desulfatitalea alkaliphila]MCJ8500213.1 helix-turn-helix transcriptional regulator [Desulfatitalea alkaliphila]